MGQIAFAKTRYHYESYDDFWKLVELSEFPTCFVDEMDLDSDNLYITTPMNGDYRAHMANHPDRRCTILHWLLERPEPGDFAGFRSSNQELQRSGLVDLNICSDTAMARACGFHSVPMGSHAGLGTPSPVVDKCYDAIPLCSYNGRRGFLFDVIDKKVYVKREWEGLTLAPNAWGEERHQNLQQSSVALNVHKDEFPFCEPIRFALFIAYGLPIVSEECDPILRGFYGPGFHEGSYAQLDDAVRYVLTHYPDFAWRAQDRRREFCEGSKTFRRLLERYL